MNTNRECGCKSFRSCFICEKEFGLSQKDEVRDLIDSFDTTYDYDIELEKVVNRASKEVSDFSGIKIIPDFINETEETQLIHGLDELPWDQSQSGRRKQNFGPKANFKKRKSKVGPFRGFPKSTEFIQDRFRSLPILEDYRFVACVFTSLKYHQFLCFSGPSSSAQSSTDQRQGLVLSLTLTIVGFGARESSNSTSCPTRFYLWHLTKV